MTYFDEFPLEWNADCLSGQLRGSLDAWNEDTNLIQAVGNQESDLEVNDLFDQIIQLISPQKQKASLSATALKAGFQNADGKLTLDRDANAKLGETAIGMLANAENRLRIVNALNRSGRITTPVRQHLDDFIAMYLFGFDRQLLVLGRAILEAVLNDVMTITKEISKPNEKDFKNLESKIDWARGWGMLKSDATYYAAEFLRLGANAILHKQPSLFTVQPGAQEANARKIDGAHTLFCLVLVLSDLLPNLKSSSGLG